MTDQNSDFANALFPTETGGVARQAETGAGTRPSDDVEKAATALFPSDAGGTDGTARAAAERAEALFNDKPQVDYAAVMTSELEQRRIGAHADGDAERVEALAAATTNLAADFRSAGTDAGDIREVFDIVRQSEGLVPPTPEQREASFAEGMATIQAEGITDSELDAARRLIADFERVSPGVVASLEAHSAGKNPALIRKVVAEAKRRGYVK